MQIVSGCHWVEIGVDEVVFSNARVTVSSCPLL